MITVGDVVCVLDCVACCPWGILWNNIFFQYARHDVSSFAKDSWTEWAVLLTTDSLIGDERRWDTEQRMRILHLGCCMPTNCFRLSLLPGALIHGDKTGLLRGGRKTSELQLSDLCICQRYTLLYSIPRACQLPVSKNLNSWFRSQLSCVLFSGSRCLQLWRGNVQCVCVT